MIRTIAALLLTATLCSPAVVVAQDAKSVAPKAAAAPKAAKDQKVCRHRFPDGKQTTWVCQKEQPCCAWDEIRYVKCGSTITRCL